MSASGKAHSKGVVPCPDTLLLGISCGTVRFSDVPGAHGPATPLRCLTSNLFPLHLVKWP